MSMPKYSVSYEYHFHELLNVLASPSADSEYLIECETEKAATYFRLRFYAFQRTLYAEGKAEELEAHKRKDAKTAQEARDKQNLVRKSKAFTVLLRGTSVLFVGRDSVQSPISTQISQLFQKASQQHAQFDAQIQTATKAAQENPYVTFLNKESTPQEAFLAETADIKPDLVRTPQWHLEQSILILKHSPKITTFTRAVFGSDQTWFLQELAATPNLPPHKATAHNDGVAIIRISSEGTGHRE